MVIFLTISRIQTSGGYDCTICTIYNELNLVLNLIKIFIRVQSLYFVVYITVY